MTLQNGTANLWDGMTLHLNFIGWYNGVLGFFSKLRTSCMNRVHMHRPRQWIWYVKLLFIGRNYVKFCRMIHWSTGNVSDRHASCMLIFILVHTCTDTPKWICKSTAYLLDCRPRVPYVRKSYKYLIFRYIVHFWTNVWMSKCTLTSMFTLIKT